MTAKIASSEEKKANPLLALTVRDYRLYWLALVAQVCGQQMFAFTLVWSLVFLSGFLLNIAGSLMGPHLALAGGATIVLSYVWLSLVRATALRDLALAPKAS